MKSKNIQKQVFWGVLHVAIVVSQFIFVIQNIDNRNPLGAVVNILWVSLIFYNYLKDD